MQYFLQTKLVVELDIQNLNTIKKLVNSISRILQSNMTIELNRICDLHVTHEEYAKRAGVNRDLTYSLKIQIKCLACEMDKFEIELRKLSNLHQEVVSEKIFFKIMK